MDHPSLLMYSILLSHAVTDGIIPTNPYLLAGLPSKILKFIICSKLE
jgi:hypothetical protein